MSEAEEKREPPFACTACLVPAETFAHPCPRCGSRKVEHAEFLRMIRGEHWRELIAAERGTVH
jgi:predicted RNA-binding Zn-ribbon protein involved in translation (DUF1610 family)